MTAARPVPAVRPGDTVAVVSPAAPDAGRCPRRLARAAAELAAVSGVRVRVMPHARGDRGPVSGTVVERLADLYAAWADPEVRVVLSAVGGSNSNELLPELDFDLLARRPVLLAGGSDATALLLPVWQRTGLVTVFGPQLLPQFGEPGGVLPLTRASWSAVLGGGTGPLPVAAEWTDEFLDWDVADDRPRVRRANPGPRVVRAGAASGPLCGANLETLLRLAGTPYFPDLSGCLLLLETSRAFHPGAVRAQLEHLRQLGVLDAVVGLGFGRFPGPAAPAEVAATLLAGTGGLRGPVVSGLDLGHTDPTLSIPNGVPGTLAADASVRLRVDGPAVR